MNTIPKPSGVLRAVVVHFNQTLNKALLGFSVYFIPAVIGLMSVVALFAWENQYASTGPLELGIQVVKESDIHADPAKALESLRNSEIRSFYDTRLSNAPVWFSFVTLQPTAQSPQAIEFPSRHALDITCWDANSLKLLGSGNREKTTGKISEVKTGFALETNPADGASRVVCRTSAIGPARITVAAWAAADLITSTQEFHRYSGLLDGGIIVLAIFVLITAIINRSTLYLLFAAWLVVNLRMGALSAGWDTQWLGHEVPYNWLLQGRLVTITLFYVLTLTLFTTLFKDDLLRVGYRSLVIAAQWTCVPLLVLATFLPFELFLPLIWPVAGIGIAALTFLLFQILKKTQSKVAVWYAASIGIALFASLYEVLAAALGVKGLIGSVNSVTAALGSSVLTALAISEQMRQEHDERLELQDKLEHTFEAMPIGLFTLDMNGRFTSANPALLASLGQDALQEGRNFLQDYFAKGAWARIFQMVHSPEPEELEINAKQESDPGETKRFLVKATLANGRIEGSLQDVTEKSRSMEKLNFLANHDYLTKVLNRRGIGHQLSQAIEGVKEGQLLSLGYLDLDRFKLINDLYGHAAGDDVLCQVCQRVSHMISDKTRFGRVGGDEFVLVCPDMPIELATHLCRRVIDGISKLPYRVGEKAFYLRGSIGLVEVSPGMQFNDAMSAADRACRQAKSASATGLVVYERGAAAFEQHEAELKLIALLATSAATDGLYLEMQPIMSLTDPHGSLNFEVLLRMRDAQGAVVRTDHLIAAGEASGRMGMIDRWVLATTLAWIKEHEMELQNTRFICMNLSGASLNDEQFLEDVYATLEQNLPLVSKLCLEITESVALHDIGNTRRFVDKIRGYGAKVALDDFGAGYTSFSYLKEFTADLLKIDGSFIINMNQHPANIAIVEAIVNLAKNLGMKVIAEWAEDQATVQTLVEIGVDYVQGFVVARPQHPDQLLTPESSASFIKDELLAEMMKQIGQPDVPGRTMMDFTLEPPINLH